MSEIARRSKTPRKSVGHAASSRPNSCSPVVTRSSPRNFAIFHCRSPGVAGRNCVSCFVSSEAMLRPTTLRHAELRSTIDSITSALFYDFLCPIVEERLAISAQSVHRCKARLVGYNFFADCTGLPSFVWLLLPLKHAHSRTRYSEGNRPFSSSRACNVIDLGVNRKPTCDFLY